MGSCTRGEAGSPPERLNLCTQFGRVVCGPSEDQCATCGRLGRPSGIILRMRAALKYLIFDPEPTTLPAEPASFSFWLRLIVGPKDGPGEESFDLTVCSPEWLAVRCRQQGIVMRGITSS